MRLLRSVLVTGLAVGSAVWSAPVANAACHAFTVSATSPVTEGGAVNVTVTRDGAVEDSNITVRAVDGTAKAGSDYAATQRRVDFEGSSTSESFPIVTVNDTTVESAESFTLVLESPGGCSGGPYNHTDTATVTINDNDVAPTTAVPTTLRPTTTLSATTTTTIARTTSTSSTPTSSTSTSTSSTTTTTVVEDDSDDSSAIPLLILGLVLVGAAAVAVAVALRRRAAGAPPEA